MNLVTAMVLGYVGLQLLFGFFFMRTIKTEQDYLLAGRSLGPFLVMFSVFATWFGAESCIGATGEAYARGLAGTSVDPFGYASCILLLGLLLAVPLWKLGITTLADLFRLRYGLGVERLAAVIMIPTSLLWAAAQVRGFGQVLAASSDLDPVFAMSVAAGVVIIYTTVGGMLADTWSDFVQGIIMVLGLLLTGFLVLQGGGWEALAAVPPERLSFRPAGTPWLEVIETFSVPILGSLVAQELVSRVISARSPQVARNSTIAAGLMYLLVGLIPVSLGLAAATLLPGVAESEQIITLLAQKYLPQWAYVLFIGALVSAILSTVNTTLLVCGSLTAHNLVLPFRPQASEQQKVLYNRSAVVAYGVLAFAIALSSESVYSLVELASSLGSSGLLVCVLFGLFARGWGGRYAAYGALLAGLGVYVLADFVVGADYPFLLSLAAALTGYFGGALLPGGKSAEATAA